MIIGDIVRFLSKNLVNTGNETEISRQGKSFLFLHIQKTGGVTFHYVITQQYTGYLRNTLYIKEKVQEFMKLPLAEKEKYSVVKGHFWFKGEEFFPLDKSVYFTFLRQPEKRLISHYFYLYQNPAHWFYKEMTANNYTLKEMLQNGKVVNLDNNMVRYLSGNVWKPWDTITEEDYRLAVKNFDEYFFHFGLNEFYDESLLMLAHELGWKTPYYITLNKGEKKQKPDFDDETWQLIRHHNRFDELLYAHAAEKFRQKMAQHKDMLERELSGFRANNKKHISLRLVLCRIFGERFLW